MGPPIPPPSDAAEKAARGGPLDVFDVSQRLRVKRLFALEMERRRGPLQPFRFASDERAGSLITPGSGAVAPRARHRRNHSPRHLNRKGGEAR